MPSLRMEINALSGADWNQAIAALPGAHVLQTWQWGQFKRAYGWQPEYLLWRDDCSTTRAAALALTRAAPGGLKVLYLPRVSPSDQSSRGPRGRYSTFRPPGLCSTGPMEIRGRRCWRG